MSAKLRCRAAVSSKFEHQEQSAPLHVAESRMGLESVEGGSQGCRGASYKQGQLKGAWYASLKTDLLHSDQGEG